MSIIDFLIALRREVSVFTENTSNYVGLSTSNLRLKYLNQQLVIAYYRLIEYYFADSRSISSDNFFTEEEIQLVIDKINNIMKTYLHTDFS